MRTELRVVGVFDHDLLEPHPGIARLEDDELHAGDMWNSNSLASWLLTDAGLDRDVAAARPPLGGRAPGWATGDGLPGVRDPDARAFGRFTSEAARHFKGRVGRFAIWNEPNWPSWLRPRRRPPGDRRSGQQPAAARAGQSPTDLNPQLWQFVQTV